MTTDYLCHIYNIFLNMQCNFSYCICTKLFPDDSKHFWGKWKNSEENMINFLNRLDEINKKIVLKWGYSNYLQNKYDYHS